MIDVGVLEKLRNGILLFDGAMGTALQVGFKIRRTARRCKY